MKYSSHCDKLCESSASYEENSIKKSCIDHNLLVDKERKNHLALGLDLTNAMGRPTHFVKDKTSMKTDRSEQIVILGLSDKPDRYSYKAHKKLLENGYTNQIGVSPKRLTLENVEQVSSLDQISKPVHTLTIYVGVERLEPMITDILSLAPKRIITNPGTENANLIAQAKQQGIEVIEGCTLVMLASDKF